MIVATANATGISGNPFNSSAAIKVYGIGVSTSSNLFIAPYSGVYYITYNGRCTTDSNGQYIFAGISNSTSINTQYASVWSPSTPGAQRDFHISTMLFLNAGDNASATVTPSAGTIDIFSGQSLHGFYLGTA